MATSTLNNPKVMWSKKEKIKFANSTNQFTVSAKHHEYGTRRYTWHLSILDHHKVTLARACITAKVTINS